MILPVQITFRNMSPSTVVEEWIQSEAAKLDEFYDRITGCRVVVELPNRRHKWGSLYHVRVDLTVPGGELIVKREPSLRTSLQQVRGDRMRKHLEVKAPHRELRQAIDDAFKAAGRRLQDYARRQRGDVKAHEHAPRARVSKLIPAEGYGFLETPGGREIYFHEHSVLGDGFRRLQLGTVVTFVEEQGERGPQASTVRLVPARSQRTPETAMVASLSYRQPNRPGLPAQGLQQGREEAS